jgi:iron complex outermembrane receptor protein
MDETIRDGSARWHCPLLGFLFLLCSVATAAEQPEDFFDLSLDELMDITVTSVSKQEESLRYTPAAASVVTHEDLRRLGVTNLPDALRAVPGVQVAQMDAKTWAVSVRGFDRQFSNKLLVMMDGRTLYTPLFSGVWWDMQDVILEDIDRIEVIRGPGGSLWGANAVNGVINIITKKAGDTQGGYASAAAGTQLRGLVEARQGVDLGEKGHLRYHARLVKREEEEVASGQPDRGDGLGDDWTSGRAGFRWDWHTSSEERTLQGDVSHAAENQKLSVPVLSPPFTDQSKDDQTATGAYLLGRWGWGAEDGPRQTLQTYFDYVGRDTDLAELKVYTLDFDFQQTRALNARNELIWGAGYRYIWDDLSEKRRDGVVYLNYQPDSSSYDIASAFVQNKTALVPERLFLTLGSKFEHNDYTGFEVQPNVRLAWLPRAEHMVWGAVSRAVRTPTRGEHGLDLISGVAGPGFIALVGDEDGYNAEELIAYEVGYRGEILQRASLDATVFYHDYDSLRTFEPVAPFGSFSLPLVASNEASGEARGVELALTWAPLEEWRLSAAYSYLDVDIDMDGDSNDILAKLDETNYPEHQFNVRSYWNINADWSLDSALYYVDELEQVDLAGTDISSYWRLDARLAWKVNRDVELSLVGQNLLDDDHEEFGAPLYSQRSTIRRNVYAKVSLSF